MAHAQKPDLVFQRNWRVHLNWRGGQFSRLLAAEVCASAVAMVVMLDTPCSEAECKTTGYPLHSHVSPSLPLPCVTMCHQVLNALYILTNRNPLLHHCLLNSYILHKIIVREVTVTVLKAKLHCFFWLGLERLVEPLRNTCTMKVKANSVKQEYEKQDELKRSAMRAVAALLTIPDAGV